ncbi:MAG: peptidase domain-containing ABC transporter [Prevotellaceae bacterium]|jgi:ATP-binding cassette subfamily B protein|nr:peptidase domain-containing ABC transporter [Prevotellaceae bacterium]
MKFLKQQDAMDCGATCLQMVAQHYGRNYSLETLRSYSYIGKDGVSLLDISRAAERIGFRTIGGRLSFEVLAQKAILPCIVHWEQNHFVVVYKIKKHQGKYIIYVANPGSGLLKYSQEEFCSHWLSTKTQGEDKGVVLLLEPTNTFYETKGEVIISKRIKFLGKYFLKYKRFFVQLALGLLLGSLLQLIFPFLTQAIVDAGITGKDLGFIWLVLIAQLMLLFSRTVIDFLRRRILLHISARINISLISDFFIKLMKLPMKFFDTKLLGDLLQRIDDHNRIERFLTAQTLSLLFSVFSFLIFGIVLFIYSVKIFLVFLAGSIIYGVWIMVFLKKRRILDYKYFEQQAKNRSIVYQLINGMQEIKLQGCEQRKRWEWEDVQADLFDVNMQSLSLQQNQEAGSICINEFKNIIITVFAAASVISGELTLGMMLAVQYIIGQLNSPVEQIMGFAYQWQDVSISLERMTEIHTRKNEENEFRNVNTIKNNDISIENLCFKYDGARSDYVLKNMNLKIPQARITAIVGASGSGKTTLVKLLLGYYSPNEGKIIVGNDNLEDINLTWWRKECGAVMQDGYIFSESIARNIAVSDEEIDLNKLREAAQIANIADYIENLPLAYNTIIGQDGQGISQGQRQRILIARAVYKNPQFLFFDEATNALDANNEKIIVENLNKFYKNKTVIIVAHRLSTVKNADQIIVLDKGEIVECGTHYELTLRKGKYYELVKNQLELGN